MEHYLNIRKMGRKWVMAVCYRVASQHSTFECILLALPILLKLETEKF